MRLRSARLPTSEEEIRKCEELGTHNAINTSCPSGVLCLCRIIERLDLEETLEVSSPAMTITVMFSK